MEYIDTASTLLFAEYRKSAEVSSLNAMMKQYRNAAVSAGRSRGRLIWLKAGSMKRSPNGRAPVTKAMTRIVTEPYRCTGRGAARYQYSRETPMITLGSAIGAVARNS